MENLESSCIAGGTSSGNQQQPLFGVLKRNILSVRLPTKRWMAVKDPFNRILFARIDENLQSHLVIFFDEKMHVYVSYDNEIVDWMKWNAPKSQTDVEEILKVIDTCFPMSA